VAIDYAYPVLPAGHLALAGVQLQAHANLLKLYDAGDRGVGRCAGCLAWAETALQMPSVWHIRARPGTKAKFKKRK